jgi:hypothetical protein
MGKDAFAMVLKLRIAGNREGVVSTVFIEGDHE